MHSLKSTRFLSLMLAAFSEIQCFGCWILFYCEYFQSGDDNEHFQHSLRFLSFDFKFDWNINDSYGSQQAMELKWF